MPFKLPCLSTRPLLLAVAGIGLMLYIKRQRRPSTVTAIPAHIDITVLQLLERAYLQLRELSAALQTTRDAERIRIARELHDDLGQLLAALRTDLNLLQQQKITDPVARKLLDSMDQLLLTAIVSLRRITGNLRPLALENGELYFALEGLLRTFSERYGIAYILDAETEELTLNDAYNTTIFRIVQEALTNIARHAHASNVEVALHRSVSSLRLTIRDDGDGIADQDMDKTSSYGLIGMRERVSAFHGEISIDGGNGTLIKINLPLPPALLKST